MVRPACGPATFATNLLAMLLLLCPLVEAGATTRVLNAATPRNASVTIVETTENAERRPRFGRGGGGSSSELETDEDCLDTCVSSAAELQARIETMKSLVLMDPNGFRGSLQPIYLCQDAVTTIDRYINIEDISPTIPTTVTIGCCGQTGDRMGASGSRATSARSRRRRRGRGQTNGGGRGGRGAGSFPAAPKCRAVRESVDPNGFMLSGAASLNLENIIFSQSEPETIAYPTPLIKYAFTGTSHTPSVSMYNCVFERLVGTVVDIVYYYDGPTASEVFTSESCRFHGTALPPRGHSDTAILSVISMGSTGSGIVTLTNTLFESA